MRASVVVEADPVADGARGVLDAVEALSVDALLVEFHPELTHLGSEFPLRIDPCDPSPKAARGGGHWSDHHGTFEPDPTYAAA